MIVFSGIQPSGRLHLGNYFGAINQWLKLQEDSQARCFFCIVDLHAITVPYNPDMVKKMLLETAVDYFAVGLDPKKSVIFVQSLVPEHTELNWLLTTQAPLGELKRMHQFKDKSSRFRKHLNAGLLMYPVLQAADILLYDADSVPVGEDQKQHIELAREIARRFNARFGDTFVLPRPLLGEKGRRIKSLKNPERKMSKTEPEGCLFLADSPEVIHQKIRQAVTDSGTEIKYDPENRPAISNLIEIFSLVADKPVKSIESDFKEKGYQEFKQELADHVELKFESFRQRRAEILRSLSDSWQQLKKNSEVAREKARKKIADVKGKMGLRY